MTYLLKKKNRNFENLSIWWIAWKTVDIAKRFRWENSIFHSEILAYFQFFTVKTRHNSLSLRLIEEGSKRALSLLEWNEMEYLISQNFDKLCGKGNVGRWNLYLFFHKICGEGDEWRWFSSNKIIKFSYGKRSQLMWQIVPPLYQIWAFIVKKNIFKVPKFLINNSTPWTANFRTI